MAKPIVIDFSNVSEGFSMEDGDYVVKVQKIETKTSQAGSPYFNWELMVVQGPRKGAKLFHITSLKEAALFNLRNTLIALGVDVPKGKMKLDIQSCLKKVMGVTVVNEKYEGKDRPKIKDTWAVVKSGNEYAKASEAYEDEEEEDEDTTGEDDTDDTEDEDDD